MMSFDEQLAELNECVAALPTIAQGALGDTEPAWVIEEMVAPYQLLLGEMGNVWEATGKAISGEIPNPETFQKAIAEGIEEDHQSAASRIAAAINERILSKIFTALGKAVWNIKAPVPLEKKVEPIGGVKVQPSTSISATQNAPMDEKNLRALLRIASGTTYTEEKLREKFETLPTGLRQAIASVDTANTVQAIAKKYLLHVDQMGALASETGLVLLGLTHPRDFTKNLATRLRLSDEKSLQIAKEISAQILLKVKEALRGLHSGQTMPTAQPTTPPPEKKPEPLVKKLNVLSAQAALETPYSAQAKWETEPKSTIPNTEYQKRGERTLLPKAHEVVGPTGWRPPASPPPPEKKVEPLPPERKVPPFGGMKVQSLPPERKVPPFGGMKAEPLRPKNFLDEKLAHAVSLPPQEKRYSVDPYREPLN